nr:hypothetical protein GCM10020241_00640 [Streptoalloteichus tenebrarius]
MDKSDHRAVSSTGSSQAAKSWRARQKKLVDDGRFDEAMRMDIDDIRARFGDKYDAHIEEMLDGLKRNKEYQELARRGLA